MEIHASNAEALTKDQLRAVDRGRLFRVRIHKVGDNGPYWYFRFVVVPAAAVERGTTEESVAQVVRKVARKKWVIRDDADVQSVVVTDSHLHKWEDAYGVLPYDAATFEKAVGDRQRADEHLMRASDGSKRSATSAEIIGRAYALAGL